MLMPPNGPCTCEPSFGAPSLTTLIREWSLIENLVLSSHPAWRLNFWIRLARLVEDRKIRARDQPRRGQPPVVMSVPGFTQRLPIRGSVPTDR